MVPECAALESDRVDPQVALGFVRLADARRGSGCDSDSPVWVPAFSGDPFQAMPRRLPNVGSRLLPSHRSRLGACPDDEGMRRLCARTIPRVTDSSSAKRRGLPDYNDWDAWRSESSAVLGLIFNDGCAKHPSFIRSSATSCRPVPVSGRASRVPIPS